MLLIFCSVFDLLFYGFCVIFGAVLVPFWLHFEPRGVPGDPLEPLCVAPVPQDPPKCDCFPLRDVAVDPGLTFAELSKYLFLLAHASAVSCSLGYPNPPPPTQGPLGGPKVPPGPKGPWARL